MASRSRQPRDIRIDAARLLRRRPLSARELSDRLAALGHAPDQIAPLIEDLRASRLIDDRRLAEAVAAAELRGHASTSRIADRLRVRGLPPDTPAQSLADDGRSEADRASELARHALATRLDALPVSVQARRLAALLARRGYDDETVQAVIAEMIPEAADPLPSFRSSPEP